MSAPEAILGSPSCGSGCLCPAHIRINGLLIKFEKLETLRNNLLKRRMRKAQYLQSYFKDNSVSLVESVKTRRLQSRLIDKQAYHRRSQRARHALEAGMTKHYSSGLAKFLTLTSPNDTDPLSINPHWEILKKRITRRLGDKFEYCKLRTLEGNGVIHAIIITPRINIEWIKENWEEIHGANKCWITEIYRWESGLTNYLASYLQGQGTRLSYSWNWYRKGWATYYRALQKRLKNHYQLVKHSRIYDKATGIELIPPYFCISAWTVWWFRVYEPPLFEWFLQVNLDPYAELTDNSTTIKTSVIY